jgi:hypothetical protein
MGSIYSPKGQRNVYLYGGHDPEDFQHQVGKPTVLDLHLTPGYRLILNNVLFPAARKKNRRLIYNKLLK